MEQQRTNVKGLTHACVCPIREYTMYTNVVVVLSKKSVNIFTFKPFEFNVSIVLDLKYAACMLKYHFLNNSRKYKKK